MKTINNRTTEYPIDDIFLKRFSPRAMSGEEISKESKKVKDQVIENYLKKSFRKENLIFK